MSNCGSKRKMAYGGKVRKMAQGGKMKPVDKEKNPGLAKLPTEVRNNMGYMRNGGEVGKPKQKYKDLLQRGKPKPPQKPKLPKMSDKPKAKPMKKGGMAKKKAPKGMHYMPDGTLMKDSAHKKKSKKMMYGGTVKKMKHGGMAKCKRDGIAMRGRTRAGK